MERDTKGKKNVGGDEKGPTLVDHAKANVLYEQIVDVLVGHELEIGKLALFKARWNLFELDDADEIETYMTEIETYMTGKKKRKDQ